MRLARTGDDYDGTILLNIGETVRIDDKEIDSRIEGMIHGSTILIFMTDPEVIQPNLNQIRVQATSKAMLATTL